MSRRRRSELNHSTARTLAASIGSIPVALAIGVALALALPLPENVRLTIGWYAVVPVWVGIACVTFLAASARRAWLGLLAALVVSLLIALLALGVERRALSPVSTKPGVG